ncbi:MAG: hypothetical protein JXA93_10550 [Anaerolineae bacterium]|nr:hypothetical protein [Anaerolineae bacterium]
MDEEKQCTVCGAGLVGPLAPRITLNHTPPGEEAIKVEARAWICTACGLVHWYGDEESLARLQESASQVGEHKAVPGTSYERRTQVLRMLRRVRRM